MVNLPAFCTSLAPTPARQSSTFMHSDFFSAVDAARASARPVFVRGLPLAFIALAFIALVARKLWARELLTMRAFIVMPILC